MFATFSNTVAFCFGKAANTRYSCGQRNNFFPVPRFALVGEPIRPRTIQSIRLTCPPPGFQFWPNSEIPTLSSCIPRLPLAAQRKHEYRVNFRDVAIQGHVPPRAAPDHQLSLIVRNRSPDQGVLFEHRDRLNNFPDTRGHVVNIVLDKVIEDALEVIPDLWGQFDSRHPQRASFLATGRLAALPVRRSSR